eukprot:965445-Rhodomonas_salina.3
MERSLGARGSAERKLQDLVDDRIVQKHQRAVAAQAPILAHAHCNVPLHEHFHQRRRLLPCDLALSARALDDHLERTHDSSVPQRLHTMVLRRQVPDALHGQLERGIASLQYPPVNELGEHRGNSALEQRHVILRIQRHVPQPKQHRRRKPCDRCQSLPPYGVIQDLHNRLERETIRGRTAIRGCPSQIRKRKRPSRDRRLVFDSQILIHHLKSRVQNFLNEVVFEEGL